MVVSARRDIVKQVYIIITCCWIGYAKLKIFFCKNSMSSVEYCGVQSAQ